MTLIAPHKKQTSKGFTLLEVLVVVSIMLILLTISVEGFGQFSTGASADSSARQVLRALNEAHARTLSAESGTQYGVHFASGTVTVFPGDTYVSGDSDNVVYTLHRATIDTVSLSGGTSDVVFARLRGAASATGTVTVVQMRDASVTRTITIHESGLAETQ